MEIKTRWESVSGIAGEPITITASQPIGISAHSLGFFQNSNSYTAIPEIEKVIFQKTHTIVLWKDKTKTIVNCSEENFDKEKGLAMAIARKVMPRGKFKKLLENANIQEV